ncbi:hypothetical protein Tco_0565509 [Tanacetum coccineum]
MNQMLVTLLNTYLGDLKVAGTCRYDNSLGLITKMIVSLIQEDKDDVLDLKKAATMLDQKMKVIKKESEGLGLPKINDDLFTYDTSLGTDFDEFNRLSGMDDDFCLLMKFRFLGFLVFHVPCNRWTTQDDGDLGVYEQRVCFDENESVYAEAVIFIKDRLVRLIDVTLEQWLELKYREQSTVANKEKENVITTWLVQNYKKQFEEYMEIKRQWEVYGLYTNKRGDDEVVLTDEEISDLEDENLIDENEIVEIFKIQTDIFNFETPLCKAFNEFNYLLKVDTNLFTHDIPGFKTYEEYKNAWIIE